MNILQRLEAFFALNGCFFFLVFICLKDLQLPLDQTDLDPQAQS